MAVVANEIPRSENQEFANYSTKFQILKSR